MPIETKVTNNVHHASGEIGTFSVSSSSVTHYKASANFVRAISDLLETDPSDLLTELGYRHPDKARESSKTTT